MQTQKPNRITVVQKKPNEDPKLGASHAGHHMRALALNEIADERVNCIINQPLIFDKVVIGEDAILSHAHNLAHTSDTVVVDMSGFEAGDIRLKLLRNLRKHSSLRIVVFLQSVFAIESESIRVQILEALTPVFHVSEIGMYSSKDDFKSLIMRVINNEEIVSIVAA